MVKFNKTYFLLSVLLFVTEALISRYVHDAFIRPYGGDFLVVILLYCFVKSFVNTPVLPTIGCVLVIAYTVEISQYFHLINLLGLQNSTWARLVLGTSFSFVDMGMYTLGIFAVIVMENLSWTLKNF